ncbi:Elongation factor 1-gamma [Giardia muris]|uniref:Elongation factor 1-gamma n=1 Tax=Giardia muris TaxID=5742 RepID=A0A4Z1SWN1_GIAMU|nr:Elongation factor 1-gamma [Giardia muris]|eukprot:TNJ29970.1 Elongation factor 1-gamma [Giardia muris]
MLITGHSPLALPVMALASSLGLKYETSETTPCGCTLPHVHDGDVRIAHSPAALRYIARKHGKGDILLGKTPEDEALIEQGVSLGVHLQNLVRGVVMTILMPQSVAAYNKSANMRGREMIEKLLTVLDKRFLEKTFYATERYTIADFALVVPVAAALARLYPKDKAEAFPNLIRWARTVHAIPGVSDVMNEISFAASPLPIEPVVQPGPRPEGSQCIIGKCCAMKQTCSDSSQKCCEKKQTESAGAAKPVDPYSKLTFDMYAWKKHYKNLDWDSKEKWEPYFFEHYDPKEYSLWKCEYIDPSGFKEDWKTKNLVTIWLQRLRGEKADKYTFGNVLVTKDENKDHFDIVGVFLFPLDTVPECVSECGGSSSFKFTRLAMDTEEDKKFLSDVWYWQEESDIVHNGYVFGRCVDGETWH